MGSPKSTFAAVVFALALAITLASVAVAHHLDGVTNGVDAAGSGGNDNPDAYENTCWSPSNSRQDAYLTEYLEPTHDWFRNSANRWSLSRKTCLDQSNPTKALGVEARTHHHGFYNYTGSFLTNFPYSKAPENENPAEEIAQRYTEVDMEVVNPNNIVADRDYYLHLRWDAERSPFNDQPDFYTEIEWCNKSYTSCSWDETGWFEKPHSQQ